MDVSPPERDLSATDTESDAAAAAASSCGDAQAPTLPPFITKLAELVEDSSTQSLVRWSEEHGNTAFVVWDPVEFSEVVLPKYFKHSNFCSFVRQLNIYGFHKIESERGGFAFRHEFFRKGAPKLLRKIVRRRAPQAGAGVCATSVSARREIALLAAAALSDHAATHPAQSSRPVVLTPQAAATPKRCDLDEALDLPLASPQKPQPQPQQQQYARQGCEGEGVDAAKLCRSVLEELARLRDMNEQTDATVAQLRESLAHVRSRGEELERRVSRMAEALQAQQQQQPRGQVVDMSNMNSIVLFPQPLMQPDARQMTPGYVQQAPVFMQQDMFFQPAAAAYGMQLMPPLAQGLYPIGVQQARTASTTVLQMQNDSPNPPRV
eukprot:m51a1_g6797 putative heat shock transcription (379) ;mRNA; r:209137-210591